jgi:chromosome segregation ATPase
MLARSVEVRLDDLKREVAEHMAQVARNRNRIDRLGAEIEMRDTVVAERDGEIARLKERIAGLEAELATRTSTLHDLQEEFGKGGEANAALSHQIAERDRHIERLRAEVERLSTARSEAASRERTVQERLMGRIEDLSALSRQIEAQRRQLVARQSQSLALDATADEAGEPTDDGQRPAAPLERRIEDAEREASELQNEFDRLDRIWAAKLAEVARAVATERPATEAGAVAVNSEPFLGAPPAPQAVRPEAAAEKPVEGAAPAEEEKKTASGLANVISLAQRIRALQRIRP